MFIKCSKLLQAHERFFLNFFEALFAVLENLIAKKFPIKFPFFYNVFKRGNIFLSSRKKSNKKSNLSLEDYG